MDESLMIAKAQMRLFGRPELGRETFERQFNAIFDEQPELQPDRRNNAAQTKRD